MHVKIVKNNVHLHTVVQ